MRKLKLQVQITVDGYIAGPNGELDWMEWNWDKDIKQFVEDLTNPVDCIILGRNLAEGFIPHWAKVAINPENPEYASGLKFTNTHKVVFTKTLNESQWDKTVLAKGNLEKEINKLKRQDGGDIIAYGGAEFVSSLIKEDLIDEYHLFINPTAIGKGMAIFSNLNEKLKLNLNNSKLFECGIIVNSYTAKRD